MKFDKSKRSVKWLFLGYFIAFVVIMIALLWTFRLLFMDMMYKQVKMSIVEKTAADIEREINRGGDLRKYVSMLSVNNDTSIAIIDGDGYIVLVSESESDGYEYAPSELSELRNEAFASKKGIFIKEVTSVNSDAEKPVKRVVYAKNIEIGDRIGGIGEVREGTGTIVLTCRVLPMTSTVKTINIELVTVTATMILVALCVAILLAKYVSRPLVNINNKSARLAHGDYGVVFDENSYKEVSELSKTLNYATGELGKTDRLRRELIANISHDLRTPLTMIRGYAEIMRDIPDENNAENMDVIIREAEYLTSLVNDMMDITKFEADVVGYDAERFEIGELISEIAGRYGSMYKMKGVSFDVKKSDKKHFAVSDRVKITNVIYNLINNAINHIGEDNTVYLTLEERAGGYVRIHVIDTGDGIEESKLTDIWDRYYKGERTHKRESVGSGLGLSIVKTVLNKLGCHYGVVSKVGEGSDFFFDLETVGDRTDKSL
ncbi:MAG: HAMP domain-containing sensor histidine kinase [Clostridia bacterium]|nr:HAMP domain-containing sensor histidine kinase [Clostridia bacterium]